MVQLKIAFLDEEEAYLEQLKGYLIRRKESFFAVRTYTSAQAFLESPKREDFDAVVMTEPFWERVKDSVGPAKKILFCEGAREASYEDCFSVKKYQSAERLFCQISAMLWQEEAKEQQYLPENTAELIGIYSPVHHENQMLFGMTMAQVLAETQKVLYVNLMEHSGFYELTKSEAAEDIGDLFYGMMQAGHDFAAGLHRIRQSYRNFDYIPPAVNPEHLAEASKALYETLFVKLKNCSGYDVVLVDFGMIFLGFAEMLPVFESFYCLGREGLMNRYRTEEFFEYLGKEGSHIAEHMNRLLLPEQLPYPEDGGLLENSLYGGMGDYIRRCLYGGTGLAERGELYLVLKEAVLKTLDNSRELSDEELLACIGEELSRRDKTMLLTLSQRRQYAEAIFASFRKFGVLQELIENGEVTEILVNGPGQIFYERAGELKAFEKCFSGEEELSDLIQTICAGGNRMVNEASPIVDTRLYDGSRVNIVLNPISLDGAAISIRKFSKEPMRMSTLLAYGSLSEEITVFLEKLVKAGYNIFVSGGTGSGKTTFLNALSEFIPKDERVITIEDSAELQLNGIANLVRLETRAAGFDGVAPIGIRDLIRTALRMRPDRVLVGECRGPEALDLLSANNTGHSGSMGTGHANSARDMLSRLETMVLMGADLPVSAIRGQIASGIDVFIHLGRMRDKSRKVLEIAELDGIAEGEIRLNVLYRFVETGEKEGKLEGRWERTGRLRHTEKWEAAGF